MTCRCAGFHASIMKTPSPTSSELATKDGDHFVGRAAGPLHHRTVAVGTHVVQADDAFVGRAVGPPHSRTVAAGTDVGIDVAYRDPGQVAFCTFCYFAVLQSLCI